MFAALAVFGVANLLLVAIGAASLFGTWRAPARRRRLRLVLALVPLLTGTFLVFCARVPLQMEFENGTRKLQFDLCWTFLLPLAIGVLALVAWFRSTGKVSDVA